MARGVLAIVLVLSFWPMAARVQDLGQEADPGLDVAPVEAEDDAPSRFMQVVAQGIVELPDEVGWRVAQRRAVAPARSEAAESHSEFVLAGPEPLVLTDEAGSVWQRLGAGAAAWTPPGEMLAVASAENPGAAFYEIGLDDDREQGIVGEAFSLTPGAYDVVLMRGALARTDEATIAPSTGPMLLLVTSGSLFAQDAAGVVTEVGAREPVLMAGKAVLSGASRNPAEFVVARIGALQETPLTLLGAGTPVGATPVATRDATLRVTALLCKEAASSLETCDAPAAGVPMTVVLEDGTAVTRITNRQGDVSLAGLPVGEATLAALMPGSVVTRSIACHPEGIVAPDEVTMPLGAGQETTCTWLLQPRDGELAVGISLALDIRACPEGMTPVRLATESCEPAEAGTLLTLAKRDSGDPLGVGEALPERWRWDRLEPGSYTLTVEAVPEGFVAYSLAENPLAEGETGFPVRIPAGFLMRGETLYLYPPDVARTHSLAIETWACPPGMTGETLVPESCAPVPEGVDLVLRESGADVPVFAAQDGVWVWSELGALPYDLEIAELPDKYSGGQLDDDCCESEDRFALRLREAEPEARHVLYLWQPFDDDPERDSDGDGLQDVREVEAETNPFLADSDEDGLIDQDEVDFYGTDPLNTDTDSDDLTDTEEVTVTITNPFLADSDGDGVDDADEIAAGTDPLEVLSLPGALKPSPVSTATPSPMPTQKTIGTQEPSATVVPTVPSWPERAATPGAVSGGSSSGASASTAASAGSPEFALDGDGLTTMDEISLYNTDPTLADTDGDGVNDGDEVGAGSNPRDPRDK